jgi:hypothetical protein
MDAQVTILKRIRSYAGRRSLRKRKELNVHRLAAIK